MKNIINLKLFQLLCLSSLLLTSHLPAFSEPIPIVIGENKILESGNIFGSSTYIMTNFNRPTVLEASSDGKEILAHATISGSGPRQGGGGSGSIGIQMAFQPGVHGELSMEAEITVTVEYRLSATVMHGIVDGRFTTHHTGYVVEELTTLDSGYSHDVKNVEMNKFKEIKFKKVLSTTGDNSILIFSVGLNAYSYEPDSSIDIQTSAKVRQIVINFTGVPYCWRGIGRPNIEKIYYDVNNPPVFLLRDFEYKSHQYKLDGSCGSPIRGNLPVVTFGVEVPEANGATISSSLSLKIADEDIYEFPQKNSPYAEYSAEIPDLANSLTNLSKVMGGEATIADGVAFLTYSYGGNPPVTKDFNFKAKIPRFEGLYIFTHDANGYWDWEPYHGDLADATYVYLLVHGWQSTKYPNFMWMYDMALSMKNEQPDVPVLGWFWQEESFSIEPITVSGHVLPQAISLQDTLISKHLSPSAKVHFIGHSFGGFMSLMTISKLLDYRKDSNNIFDGWNFKLTLGDTDQRLPNGFIYYVLHLLSNGVDVENYYSNLGRTITDLGEFKKYKERYNIQYSDQIDQSLCGDHGAPVWYYLDNKLWLEKNNPWIKREKFRYTHPWRTIITILHLLLPIM